VAFTWPLFYRKFKQEIDLAVSEGRKQFHIHSSKIKQQLLAKMGKGSGAGTKEE
jgi:hypothetical protein